MNSSILEIVTAEIKGVRKGGLGLKTPLELDILEKLYDLRKEMCFRILLLINLST